MFFLALLALIGSPFPTSQAVQLCGQYQSYSPAGSNYTCEPLRRSSGLAS
jgi:hypothetical protein